MNVAKQLASALERRDEQPNIELARKVAATGDPSLVRELVSLLYEGKRAIQNDSIKVLYEIGLLNPTLIAPYCEQFVALLQSKNNRLQWGAMIALGTIVHVETGCISQAITQIVDAADRGTVITKDHAFKILVQLYSKEKYAEMAFALLNEQLYKSPVNQLPMYAELAMEVMRQRDKATFIHTLQTRLADVDKESKRKRINNVLKKIGR